MADIEKMKKQLAEIKARIKAAESREAKKRRAEDTRRKVLIGAIVLEEARKNHKFGVQLTALLRDKLTRPHDRALFGLDKLDNQTDTPSASKPDIAE